MSHDGLNGRLRLITSWDGRGVSSVVGDDVFFYC